MRLLRPRVGVSHVISIMYRLTWIFFSLNYVTPVDHSRLFHHCCPYSCTIYTNIEFLNTLKKLYNTTWGAALWLCRCQGSNGILKYPFNARACGCYAYKRSGYEKEETASMPNIFYVAIIARKLKLLCSRVCCVHRTRKASSPTWVKLNMSATKPYTTVWHILKKHFHIYKTGTHEQWCSSIINWRSVCGQCDGRYCILFLRAIQLGKFCF